MALATRSQVNSPAEGRRYASGTLTGTRTAANFKVTLGFIPSYIKVINLTDQVKGEQFIDANLGTVNAEGILTIANGTVTYADVGIAYSLNEYVAEVITNGAVTTLEVLAGPGFSVTVATAGLETDDDDVYWEAWA